MYKVHLLPASFGDSILIEYGNEQLHYILIDGGPYYMFGEIMQAIKKIAPGLKELELLVVTHIDIDHIDGIVTLLNQKPLPFAIKDIWFNGYKQLTEDEDVLGALQGEYLTRLIEEKKLVHNESFKGKAVCCLPNGNLHTIKLDGGMAITLLAPTRDGLTGLIAAWDKEMKNIDVENKWAEEHRYDGDILGEIGIEELQAFTPAPDKSAANVSSIAFLASYDDKSCLFAGDSPTHILLPAINQLLKEEGEEADRLKINAWKLAHHGSRKSTHDSLMQKLDCRHLLFSSDGKRYHHPEPEVPAKLIKHNGPQLHFYFNYRSEYTAKWDDDELKTKHRYTTHFPENGSDSGISIVL